MLTIRSFTMSPGFICLLLVTVNVGKAVFPLTVKVNLKNVVSHDLSTLLPYLKHMSRMCSPHTQIRTVWAILFPTPKRKERQGMENELYYISDLYFNYYIYFIKWSSWSTTRIWKNWILYSLKSGQNYDWKSIQSKVEVVIVVLHLLWNEYLIGIPKLLNNCSRCGWYGTKIPEYTQTKQKWTGNWNFESGTRIPFLFFSNRCSGLKTNGLLYRRRWSLEYKHKWTSGMLNVEETVVVKILNTIMFSESYKWRQNKM